MSKNAYDQAFECLHESVEYGVLHLTTREFGRSVDINNRVLLNFSSCDYLALSHDERLKKGAIKAIEEYGVISSASHGYIKLKIYEEAEALMAPIFGKPVVVFPRTTLAHIGVLPTLVNADDIVLLDHQVHTSARLAASVLPSQGIHIETVRHSAMEALEKRIKELSSKYKRIWYLIDGVYSMYGDLLPYKELTELLNKYEQFRLYIDDAHGMSWNGENGRGVVLDKMDYHPNMVLVTSLAKGFGAGGGAVVCYDQKVAEYIVTCAPPLNFTLPVTPSMLGAIIESAKIHLSDEIKVRQNMLKERVSLFYTMAREYDLPILSDPITPIKFLATGKPDMCREICLNLMERDFFTNVSHYPAVPINNSGVRVVITAYQELEDITKLVVALKEEFEKALKKRDLTVHDILKHYKLIKP